MDRDLEVTVKLLNSADDIQRLIKFFFFFMELFFLFLTYAITEDKLFVNRGKKSLLCYLIGKNNLHFFLLSAS